MTCVLGHTFSHALQGALLLFPSLTIDATTGSVDDLTVREDPVEEGAHVGPPGLRAVLLLGQPAFSK